MERKHIVRLAETNKILSEHDAETGSKHSSGGRRSGNVRSENESEEASNVSSFPPPGLHM